MTVIRTQVRTQFARRAVAVAGTGLDAAEAVAAAEARIDSMREDTQGHIADSVREMLAARSAIAGDDPEAEHKVRMQADALVGLCGLFELTEIGTVASSLCKLFDNCLPGRPDARGISVHLDALHSLWSLPPGDRALGVSPIVDGLSKIVNARMLRDPTGSEPV